MNKAIKSNNLEEVKRLYLADPKRHYGGCELQYHAMHLAAMAGNTRAVRLLSSLDPPCIIARDINGWRPLVHAVRAGHRVTAEVILDLYRNAIEWMDTMLMSPLHHAAITGDVSMAQMLLRYDSDVEHEDCHGRTPIFWAVYKGHEEMTRMLFDLDPAAPTRRDNAGKTIAHVAASWEHPNLMPLLFERGCDLDAQDNDGWTPMHIAAASGYDEMLSTLHRLGSKAHFTKTKDNQTPMDVIRSDETRRSFSALLPQR